MAAPTIGGKLAGYRAGAELGDPLTDNTRRMDAYRFHDAIHLGFMAVLGWSPCWPPRWRRSPSAW